MTTKQKIKQNNKSIEELEGLCKSKNIQFTYVSYWSCLIDYEFESLGTTRQHTIDLENNSTINKFIKLVKEI